MHPIIREGYEMLLAIDVGNTNLVFAIVDQQQIRHQWRISTNDRRTADEYRVWLNELLGLENVNPKDIDGVVISSVVPATNRALGDLCENYLNQKPVWVGDADTKLGIEVLINNPSEVGADRLVNVVAAYEKLKKAAIILDFGTATTLDVMSNEGAYLGGIICPGINLSLKALYDASAKLPMISIEEPKHKTIIGKSTTEAMSSGIYWGYIAMIEGLVARLKAEHGDMPVVATGGLSTVIAKNATIIDHVEPELTVMGLKAIWHMNKS